jgi:hypothetical protein
MGITAVKSGAGKAVPIAPGVDICTK